MAYILIVHYLVWLGIYWCLVIACVSVESGDGVPKQHNVDPYYQQYPQGKTYFHFFVIYLDLWFPPKYFATIIFAFDSNVFGATLEYTIT